MNHTRHITLAGQSQDNPGSERREVVLGIFYCSLQITTFPLNSIALGTPAIRFRDGQSSKQIITEQQTRQLLKTVGYLNHSHLRQRLPHQFALSRIVIDKYHTVEIDAQFVGKLHQRFMLRSPTDPPAR
ncbi:hypothetical protein RhoFW510T8_02145 [Rhodanobacter sp. FW510-T8]|nr:hypothetical protein RhoFW510T8_02145 [Rhodanobacter sp. FW510-T8]